MNLRIHTPLRSHSPPSPRRHAILDAVAAVLFVVSATAAVLFSGRSIAIVPLAIALVATQLPLLGDWWMEARARRESHRGPTGRGTSGSP